MTLDLEALSNTISAIQTEGMSPRELHLHPKHYADLLVELGMPAPGVPSPARRFWRWLRRTPSLCVTVMGLPVLPNPDAREGAIAVRLETQMSDPNWLRSYNESLDRFIARIATGQNADEFESAPEPRKSVEENAFTVSELIPKNRLEPTCTTVLMKAFEEIDNYDDVIVLRIKRRKGEVSMMATLPQAYAFGVLRSALGSMME